jgi:hypothetical protein
MSLQPQQYPGDYPGPIRNSPDELGTTGVGSFDLFDLFAPVQNFEV